MPARAHLLRQFYLVQRLQAGRGRALPFEEIQRYLLEHPSLCDQLPGYERRTLQRDVREVAELFGVTIRSRKNQGYYLAETEELPPGHGALLEALELQEFLRLPEALAPFVQPEARRSRGLEHLRPLLRAARARQVVEFAYQKFWEDEAGTRTVAPLLLKEFRGRWYLLGQMAWGRSRHLACFGLDRMHDLRLTGAGFELPAGFGAEAWFAHAFGITRPTAGEQPQRVVLRFGPTQGEYALSYPLHHSQQVLLHTPAELQVALTVYLTHELEMELLSYGPDVEVLAPPALRQRLHERHRTAARAYSGSGHAPGRA